MTYSFIQTNGAVAANRLYTTTWTLDPRVRLNHDRFADLIDELPESIARETVCFPVHREGEHLHLASSNADDVMLQDQLRFMLNRNVVLHQRSVREIVGAINHHYGKVAGETADSLLQEFTDTSIDFTESADEFALTDSETLSPRHDPYPAAARARARRGYNLSSLKSKRSSGIYKPTRSISGDGMFFYTIEEGQKALAYRIGGKIDVVNGPARIWKGLTRFEPMKHFVAHPGEFLTVRFHDGTQQNLRGPAELWFDPRIHESVNSQEGLTLAAKEAVVVYGQDEMGTTQRRICHGPCVFVPEPGEWLHKFTWHASKGGSRGVEKTPGGLQFHKMWLMPDQMYHDVRDVRTADDAVLVIRLMIFFELLDIETMLDTTHDPIGDFINAATSDAVEFTGKLTFEEFKTQTDQLNELSTYTQLLHRAEQCGYKINNVVYRGYGAPDSLQKMHDEAIAARTRLQLEKDTEKQTQELEDYRLQCQVDRSERRRTEQSTEVEHDLMMQKKRSQATLEQQQNKLEFERQQKQLDAELAKTVQRDRDIAQREHLGELRNMGVDLTEFLTQGRADQVVELRGAHSERAQFHLGNQGNGSPRKPKSK